jgi:VWFA-related protein
MNEVMNTLGTKLISAATLVLIAFFAASAVAQSAPAANAAASSAQQSPAAAAPATNTPATSTPAQAPQTPDPNSPTDDNIPKIVVNPNEVNVVFTVTDKHGRRITDLKKNDFQVLDDNKPPEVIRSFVSETNLPLQVGLLIDASNSVRDRFKFEQESAIEFLNQTIHPRVDSAFVVGFDVTPEVTQDFTDSAELLGHGVRELRPGGGTALYDAIYFACRDKLMKAPKNVPVRRAIILLSDGEDNQSHVTREEAIEMAQRAEAVIYTISTNVSGTRSAGDKVLERMADATGGRPFFPFQIREVANAFAEIQDELRSQYYISYKPADLKHDGHYRTIEIVANDRKNLRVRSRRGWYAPAQ